MLNFTVKQLAADLAAGRFSSVEVTQYFIKRINALGKALNAFISVDEEQSLASARAADQLLAAGRGGPLTGIPLAHKDIFCAKGWLTTCGSKILSNFVAPYDAHVIARFNQAGAVIAGKTNMDEFAMGSSNETSFYGPVQNPWDTAAVPGGSSGGSAAAIAARPRLRPPAPTRAARSPAGGIHRLRAEAHPWRGVALRHDCVCVSPTRAGCSPRPPKTSR